ncbi:LPS assembly outer membrane complex protein LptD [Jannaschia rubra]|uniref:LPS assembly outer membrane complex protein LptD n=2 Tax=Jannaschia rubra TaxID=282197 RepID=A0A0M6XQ06_9RHOB|nr:lipopolysaccharide transport periplasmic protein LptA [Jannaschia rubra]CTQ32752.1 LPS assembly outer membrane complex protein LptD [Jannaschia rubra]SFF88859.1 lipopolysaccharide export system protein LptA [Jannaschia rubra]
MMILRALVLTTFGLLAGAVHAQTAAIGFGQGNFDRAAPVEVAADSLEVDQATGRATLTGNVVIAQGDLRLSANLVTVDYATTGGTRSIERLNATGDVLIVAGEDAAEGQEAVYTLGTSDILLSGDVLVTQGGNTLAGDRLAINLESGAGTVTGRVRTTLQP